MKIPKKRERLAFFRSLCEESKNKNAALYDRFDRAVAQYEGSPKIDASPEMAAVVRNITYELIESEVSVEIPQPKADPRQYSEENDICAKTVERLCARVRNELPFEKLNDLDERYTYIFGGSVWFLEWDEGAGGDGGVRVLCIDPRDFIPEPKVTEIDDMEYCFLRFRTAKAEVARRWDVPEEDLSRAEPSDTADDDVFVTAAFYRNEDGKIGRFLFTGEVVLDDATNYYVRKKEVCAACGGTRSVCRCERPQFRLLPGEWEWLGGGEDGALPSRVPYYLPRRFPVVIRRNVSAPDQLFGRSDCDAIRPQQQQINKLETRILQKLMRSGVTPILPDDAEITLNNTVFGQLIRLKPGEDRGRYGTLDTTPSIAQEVAQEDRLYDHAKRILGITDSYLGIGDGTALSGVAKQVQVEQAAGRLQSKRKMKQAAYAEIDRLIFEFHLAYADEARPLVFADGDGRVTGGCFSRRDFLRQDEKTGEWHYDDGYLFSADQNGGAEGERSAMWQRNLDNLRAGTLGDPASPLTLLHYWQCQERVHYPFARENVEYFRRLSAYSGKEDPLETNL